MDLLLRAIITGFGYKLGSELGRFVVDRFKRTRKKADDTTEAADDLPEGLPKDPANPGGDDKEDERPRPTVVAAS